MEQRQLGSNGPNVGAVALGCMSFGGFYGPTDMAESHRTLVRALELGVDHLDTADIYGNGVSEEVIGAFVKDHPGRFKIATKCGIRTKPTRSFDNSPDYIRASLEGSMKRLNVDFVDLYYIHRRDPSIPIEDVVGTLSRLKDEGKVGTIGFTEISPASLQRANTVHPIAAIQSEYSLWSRLPDLGLIEACERLGTAFVAFSPLARGMFTNKMPDAARIAENGLLNTNPRFMEPNLGFNREIVIKFNDYARDRGWSPAALALAWTLHRGPHIIPIPGTRSEEHLTENAAAAAIQLSDADMAEIETILPPGFAHGDRYSEEQYIGPERYC